MTLGILYEMILISLVPFLGMVLASNPIISVSAAALSFFCWGVTSLVYLYDYHAFPGPALLFGLFATISLLVTLWGGWRLLNPYEREKLENGI